MPTTNFIGRVTPIAADWLNEVDAHVFLEGSAINVKEEPYSATGNSTTDDTTAIQTALNDAGAQGKAVYLPGTLSYYKISNSLTVPNNVVVYGDGYTSCVKQTAREKNVFVLGERCELRGLRLQGDGVVSGGLDFLKNNGVFIDTKKNCKVLYCWIHGFEYNGVLCKNTSGLTIQGNIIYENAYSINAGSDICLYSDIGSIRTNITGNFLLSNNSQACWVNALGLDTDIAITNNFACPVDTNGVVISGVSITRRHSFMLGYVGGADAGGRISCSNNISLNTRQTGVYWQSATATGGSVTISHNYVRGAGTNAVQPALAGGIYIAAQGPSDIVMGNIVEDMPQAGFILAAGINMQPGNSGVGAGNSTLIQGNTIIDTAGHGIYIGANSQNVRVADNTVNGWGEAAYIYIAAVAFTGGRNIEFHGNRAYEPTAVKPALYLSRQSGTPIITVKDNIFYGYNNTTASTDNSGILNRDWDRSYIFEGNTLVNFYGGVGSDAYCNTNTGGPRFLNNNFHSCNAAYHISTSSTGKIVTQGDMLVSTSTYQNPALLAGNRVAWQGMYMTAAGVQIFNNATPTVGTWAQGDRVQQTVSTVGQPKGWQCTVAGNPGTWVSEGNL